jgi:hypothetical protein
MKRNRTIYIISLLLTLAVFITSFAATGAQQTEGTQQEAQPAASTVIGSGNQGAFIPAGVDPNLFHAHNIHRSQIGWVRGEVIRRAVLLEAHELSGNVIDNPNVRTYVFFKLNNSDLRAWNNGELSIVWRPKDTKTWQTCNAFGVDTQASQQTTAQAGTESIQVSQPRLACLTSTYNAYYALVRSSNQ